MGLIMFLRYCVSVIYRSEEFIMSVIGDYIKIKHGYAFKGEFISTDDNDIVWFVVK